MPPTDVSYTSRSLQIPTMEDQISSRHYNTFVQPPLPGSSQARPISVAAHTTASSQNYHSASTPSRRQRASHNVVSPSSNIQQPERSQAAHDNAAPYTDVYSHPAAVAYAAAHPRRTIPKFGPYLLLQTLGEGEFGKVKLGLHCHWGEEVAVKLIRRGNVDSSVRMSKIEREIEVLKMLKHPNIVRLYDVIETDKYIGIILEYASGGELFDHILAHRYLRERDAAKLFSQLISGVWYIHQKKIVHRDLKLENLLLDRNRNVIITDFGFANRFEHKVDDLMQTSCGSPCYAAPELVISEGLYVGSAVDIWSCGVILYAMLAGYLPFDDDPANPDGDNINLLYKYIVSTPLSFPEYISTEARDLLSTMLVPDPSRRTTLDSIMRHPWLGAYQGARTDGNPNAFGKTVEELERAAMDQHNLKRQAYQRQMRAAAAVANGVVSPSRTQSHRPEASAPATSSRSRSTQPEYLYDSSMEQSIGLPMGTNVNATPSQNGSNKKIFGSPAALGLAEDDPFAGPIGGKNNTLAPGSIDPSREPNATPAASSNTQGHRPSSSAGGSFRHTIQVEYDDSSKSSRREEKRRERTGSQSTALPQLSPPMSTPGPVTPPKERRPSQSGIKPLPPSPNAAPSAYRGPAPSSKESTVRPSNDVTPTKARPVEYLINPPTEANAILTPATSATPSISTGSEQQDRDSGSQKSTSSAKGTHKRGKSSIDRMGLTKIFGSGFGMGSTMQPSTSLNGNTSIRNSGATPVPSDGQASASSVLLAASGTDSEKEKKSRRNTLTVVVEPFSRSIRGKKARQASTPLTADGPSPSNGGKLASKTSPQPTSSTLSSSNVVTPAVSEAFDPSGMLASTNKAKKVMQWFRTRSKGRDSVGFPTEEASTPTQAKYRKGFSASSSTLNHPAPSTALGLAESAMSPQVVVTSPNSARPAPVPLHIGHPQRSASTATEPSIATPSFVTRFRNSITASSAAQHLTADKSYPHGQLRIHHGAVDPTAITTRPPPEVMAHVKRVLEGMGVEIQLESEYKYRCIRAKKRKGTVVPSPTTNASNPSPSAQVGPSLAAVTMVGSAASNGVDKRGLPLPSPSAFAGTGGMLRGLLMRRQSSQSSHKQMASSPSLAFDDETSVIISEPHVVSDVAYGDPSQDAGDEVRFSVELTRIDRLNDTYSLDIRRLKGNLRSYKFLYDTLRERADLSAAQT